MSNTKIQFVRQQGFEEADSTACGSQFGPLMFQPRVVGTLAFLAILFQSAPFFLVLGAILWWSALVPRANPFDALHNLLFGKVAARLDPALPPRRFSQGMAGSFMLGSGICIAAGWTTAGIVVQAFLVMALLSLVLGRFCLGSFIYYLVRGRRDFAVRTLPWSRS